LLSYQTVEGITGILMDGRLKPIKMRFATEELQEFYIEFEEEFTAFFEALVRTCRRKEKKNK
jgi:hypothetical protein